MLYLPFIGKEDAIEALRQAVFNRFPDGKAPIELTLIVRLDRGCQFTSYEFAKAAKLFQVERKRSTNPILPLAPHRS